MWKPTAHDDRILQGAIIGDEVASICNGPARSLQPFFFMPHAEGRHGLWFAEPTRQRLTDRATCCSPRGGWLLLEDQPNCAERTLDEIGAQGIARLWKDRCARHRRRIEIRGSDYDVSFDGLHPPLGS